MQKKTRSDYYGYVRRLPSIAQCNLLYRYFFSLVNPLNNPLDETIFRAQLNDWWPLAHEKLVENGPEALPDEFKCFPALIFQVLAFALLYLPASHESILDDLKFGPQTFTELSAEYTDCGIALSKLSGKGRLTLTGVLYSSLRGFWYVNIGDLTQAWNFSGQIVKYKLEHSVLVYSLMTVQRCSCNRTSS
jgi:hypothetical protein